MQPIPTTKFQINHLANGEIVETVDLITESTNGLSGSGDKGRASDFKRR